jgi:hypothetical protein
MRDRGLAYMNQATVSRIENCTRPVRMMEAQALSKLFERTTTSMLHPDSREIFLPLINANHAAGRRAYVKLKEGAREAARAQISAAKDLATLEELFGDGEDLHEDSKPILEGLRRNLRQFVTIDLVGETIDIVEGVRQRHVEHPEAP